MIHLLFLSEGRQVCPSGRSLENRPNQVCEVPKKLNKFKAWSSDKCEFKYSECTIKWERLRKSGKDVYYLYRRTDGRTDGGCLFEREEN